jgi:hypothetical protein
MVIPLVLMFAQALSSAAAFPPDRAELERAIVVLRGVTADNQSGAAGAWRTVAAAPIADLPLVLAGMDGTGALTKNLLRSAIDSSIQLARKEGKSLPYAPMESFVRDAKHDPQARRLAYELVLEHDKSAADRFLPEMLNDPSPEMRRDAVARVLDQAEMIPDEKKKTEALPLFQKALHAARDLDQIKKAAKRQRDMGQAVDLPKHLGLVTDWRLIGPFPNPQDKGMSTVYPPEQKYEPAASYDGKSGKVKWIGHTSTDDLGLVDLDGAVSKDKEGVGYAFTEFTSAGESDVDIRVGCYTAFKLWVNGKLVLDRGDAFTGMSLDHYRGQAHLVKGQNTFLLKIGRGEAPPPVPNHWRFQLRVCDSEGVAILSTTRPAPATPEKKS